MCAALIISLVCQIVCLCILMSVSCAAELSARRQNPCMRLCKYLCIRTASFRNLIYASMGEFEIGWARWLNQHYTLLFACALKMCVERAKRWIGACDWRQNVCAPKPKRQQVAVMCVTLSRRELRRGKNFGESSLSHIGRFTLEMRECGQQVRTSDAATAPVAQKELCSMWWHNGHHLAERITFATAACAHHSKKDLCSRLRA